MNARILAASAMQSAHRVADGALEVQHVSALRRAHHSGAQIADAGISILAHLACAGTVFPGDDPAALLTARRAFAEASQLLEQLRAMLKECETQGLISRMELMPLYHAIDETLAVCRDAQTELNSSRSNAA